MNFGYVACQNFALMCVIALSLQQNSQ